MVLVTGASGFLGRHLVSHLSSEGVKVRALYHLHPPDEFMASLAGVEWMPCDLLDVVAVEAAMQGITALYHCAGIVSYDPRRSDEMIHFNSEGTANIVNTAIQIGDVRMVHVSSIAALSSGTKIRPVVSEADEWGRDQYHSAYGLSKYLAEMEVWRGIGEGLDAVIVNPGVILGTGTRSDHSTKLMALAQKEFPYYTNGVTAWVDVADVVQTMYRLMNTGITGERYIVSGGDYSYREVMDKMAAALHKKASHIHATPLLTGIMWRWKALKSSLTGVASGVTKETAHSAQLISHYDSAKLLSTFPDFTYQKIEDTIARMAVPFLK